MSGKSDRTAKAQATLPATATRAGRPPGGSPARPGTRSPAGRAGPKVRGQRRPARPGTQDAILGGNPVAKGGAAATLAGSPTQSPPRSAADSPTTPSTGSPTETLAGSPGGAVRNRRRADAPAPARNLESGVLLTGPCVETAPQVTPGAARLVYVDPPFATDTRRVGPDTRYAYDDRWPGRLASYLPWLEENLRALLPLLAPDGSLVLHLDQRAVHYAKVLLDRLLGEESFVNEIIWHYTGGGRSKSRFSNKHDTLLWYAAGPRPRFNIDAVRVPYEPTSGYACGGIVSKAGKRYLPHPDGTPVDDVWDIPIVNPMSRERVGYPTQKPLALLERLVAALTGPGDLVVDLFCGSGTTLVAAARLGRRWIGGDRSAPAVACARQRLGL